MLVPCFFRTFSVRFSYKVSFVRNYSQKSPKHDVIFNYLQGKHEGIAVMGKYSKW